LFPRRSLLRGRQGGRARASFNLVAPLAGGQFTLPATDMRTEDTSGQLDLFAGPAPARSCAVSRPIGATLGLRPGDVYSVIDGRTPTTLPTPGSRASTTATRPGTTRATAIACSPSADRDVAGFLFKALLAAYLDFRQGKRNTHSVRAFEAELEANLVELAEALLEGTYAPGPSICFAITRPKPREVWAARPRDRVVHHLLYRHVGRDFERAFIADSCACIPGRGTHYAARRLEARIRSATQNWTRPVYYLKCDLANFFVSIDKPTLQALLERRIREPWWMDLASRILMHDPREGVEICGNPRALEQIPPHKSLFNQPAHRGLPIGNLSSQFFANVYLDVLDQFAKHQLRARHYVRYVDDFVLLHEDPRQLNAWLAAITAFLPERLKVQLNPAKTILQPVARGVDFVGHLIKPHRNLLRRRTINDAVRRLQRLDTASVPAAACSYLGHARQVSHGHHDRARIANAARRRGFAVDHRLTKVYG